MPPKKRNDPTVTSTKSTLLSTKSYVLQIPFQEWSDNYLNSEIWSLKEKSVPELAAEAKEKDTLYEDEQAVYLPPSISMVAWKRAANVFPKTEFTIFASKAEYPDLLSGSQHLLHSEFVKSFISSVHVLLYLGNIGKFSYEYTSANYVPNTNSAWKPWYHIYSKSYAGKGTKHLPQTNPYGKYIVRLFWLGSWRKVYVDDLLPVNSHDQVMLPSLKISALPPEAFLSSPILAVKSPKGKDKKGKSDKGSVKSKENKTIGKKPKDTFRVVELWPFLLSKALLKIAGLTWYDGQELLDFDIIQCLTGWIPTRINTEGLNLDDIWNLCWKYTDHYKYPEDKKKDSSKGSTKGSPRKKDVGRDDPCNCYLMVYLGQSEGIDEGTIPLQETHNVFIDETRNTPLIKPSKAEDYPLWKRYRWMEWAASEGLIPPVEPTEPINSFRTIDVFKNTLPAFESILTKDQDTAKISKAAHFVNGGGINRSAQSNSSKKKGEDIPDPSFWIDCKRIFKQIKYLIIYDKPSAHPVRIRISDFTSDNIIKEAKFPELHKLSESLKLRWLEIIRPIDMHPQRNEPLYIFTDGLKLRTIIFSLSHMGYTRILNKKGSVEEACIVDQQSDCGICIQSFLESYKRKLIAPVSIEEPQQEWSYTPDHKRPIASIVLGRYHWYADKEDEFIDCSRISSYGSQSWFLFVKPGRRIFRLWIRSHEPYVLQIFCKEPLAIGSQDVILRMMQEESHLLEEACSKISDAFDKLVKSTGKPNSLETLRAYYDSYKPSQILTKGEYNSLHDAVFEILADMVYYNLGGSHRDNLITLFRRWELPKTFPNNITDLNFCYNIETTDTNFIHVMQMAASRVIALFKGNYIRKKMKLLLPSNKKIKQLSEGLQSIYRKIFYTTNQKSLLPEMFRHLFKHPLTIDIAKEYIFYEDIDDVVELEVISYNVKGTSGWVALFRQRIYITSPESVTIRMYLICNLSQYYLRVLDNATGTEINFYTDSVTVYNYENNIEGYTIFAYGLSRLDTQIECCLMIATYKDCFNNIRIVPNLRIQTQKLTDTYIPNAFNRICKYVLYIANDIILSVRLSTSFTKVIACLRILDVEGRVVREAVGESRVFIPLIKLKTEHAIQEPIRMKRTKSFVSKRSKISLKKSVLHLEDTNTQFTIEASVINHSWPLTSHEWTVVHMMKQQMLYNNESEDVQITTADPFWTLEVASSYDEPFILTEDQKRKKFLYNMKESWYCEDPDRYRISQEIRQKYLEENLIINPAQCKDPEHRDLNQNVFEENILPEFDFSLYATIIKTKEEIHATKSSTYESYLGEDSDSGLYRLFQALRDYKSIENILEAEEEKEMKQCLFQSSSEEIVKKHTAFSKRTDSQETTSETTVTEEESFTETVIPAPTKRRLKTATDLRCDEEKDFKEISDFQYITQKLEEERKETIKKQRDRFNLLNNWFNNCRLESKAMMAEAYKMRQDLIDGEQSKAHQEKKKGKGSGKKSKKGKK